VGIFRDYPLKTWTSKQPIGKITGYELIPTYPLKYPRSKQGLSRPRFPRFSRIRYAPPTSQSSSSVASSHSSCEEDNTEYDADETSSWSDGGRECSAYAPELPAQHAKAALGTTTSKRGEWCEPYQS
jgi:hypothetical protein